MQLLRQVWGWLMGLLGNKPVVILSRNDIVKLAMETAGLRGQDWRGEKATDAFLKENTVPTDLQGEELKQAVIKAAQEWRGLNGQRYN